jgi:iron complex transport system ATP-binding protein
MTGSLQGGITLQGVSVRRGPTHALQQVSLHLEPATVTAVVGPNGAGKSTLLHVISGILAPDEGQVTVGGLTGTSDRRALAQTVAILTQHAAHMQGLSVHDTVLLGRSPWLGSFGLPSAADAQLADDAVADVGIQHLAHRPVHDLSAGERQRVHFARVMCQNTRVVLLDEPFSAQDVDGTGAMLRCLYRRAEEGVTVVVILHDLNLALAAFDHLIVLHQGQVQAHGSPDAATEAIQRIYGPTIQVTRGSPAPFVLPVWR